MFPHEKREAAEFGHSPGNGMSPRLLSREPLASEAEVAAEMDARRPSSTLKDDPTAGDDPYVFDDIGATLPQLDLSALADGPQF